MRIIEIKEEVQVGDIILEAGDKIEVINEAWDDGYSSIRTYSTYKKNGNTSIQMATFYTEREAKDLVKWLNSKSNLVDPEGTSFYYEQNSTYISADTLSSIMRKTKNKVQILEK